ncbi:MAG: mechanosensitive ion channel family protein [Gammaproteobacteria bacterium]
MNDELATLTRVYGYIVDFFVRYAFQILGAVLIMAAGAWVARAVAHAVLRMQERRHVDVTLRQFIASTVRFIVLVMFAVIALAKLGISIAPIVAAIGGAALGAGMALQGTVSNYGAGLALILGRPFKVGDTIEVQQCAGVVTEIGLGTTRLKAEDGEVIVIPNRQIVGEIHRNSFGRRIVEGSVGVAYHHDPLRAVTLVNDALRALSDVADAPAPQVGIDAFGETAIAIAYRYWVPSDRYFEIRHAANAAVYRALVDGGIDILPQREVHLVRGQA